METLSYNGYEGTCEISIEDDICYGKIIFIEDLVLYQGNNVKELKQAFESAVDDYLQTCTENKIEPKKPLKGTFNVRISPDLHKQAVLTALHENVSLNEVVRRSLEAYLESDHQTNHGYSLTLNPANLRQIGNQF